MQLIEKTKNYIIQETIAYIYSTKSKYQHYFYY